MLLHRVIAVEVFITTIASVNPGLIMLIQRIFVYKASITVVTPVIMHVNLGAEVLVQSLAVGKIPIAVVAISVNRGTEVL